MFLNYKIKFMTDKLPQTEKVDSIFPTMEDFLAIKEKARNNCLNLYCHTKKVETSFQKQIQEAVIRFIL